MSGIVAVCMHCALFTIQSNADKVGVVTDRLWSAGILEQPKLLIFIQTEPASQAWLPIIHAGT